MVPFKVVECKDYALLQQELLTYINEFTTLITNNPWVEDYNAKTNPIKYPNFVDFKHFIKHCPKMIKWLGSLKLVPRDVYFTLTWYTGADAFTLSPCKIHLDKPPVQWKMNFPILNMEPTSVRFYRLKDPNKDIKALARRVGDPDSKDNDNFPLPYEYFEIEYTHQFNKNEPIIMNGQVPHDVGVHGEVTFPRIGIQIMFVPEPLHLLK